MRRPLASTLLAVLVSGGVLLWLLRDTELANLVDALGRLPLWRSMLAILLVAVVQLLRAWRFSLMLTGRCQPPSPTLVRVTTQLLVLNFLLPFKLGEVSFPMLMRRSFGTDLGRSVGVLLLSRCFDLGTVAAILLLAAALVRGQLLPGVPDPVVAALGLVMLAAPAILVLVLDRLRPAPRSSNGRESLLRRLTDGAAVARAPGILIALLALSLLVWLPHIVLAWLVASAIEPTLSLSAVALSNAAAHLAFALPVPAIAGLGPPQAAWVAGLTMTGAAWPVATATALICHGVILAAVLVIGIASFLPWPGSLLPAQRQGPR